MYLYDAVNRSKAELAELSRAKPVLVNTISGKYYIHKGVIVSFTEDGDLTYYSSKAKAFVSASVVIANVDGKPHTRFSPTTNAVWRVSRVICSCLHDRYLTNNDMVIFQDGNTLNTSPCNMRVVTGGNKAIIAYLRRHAQPENIYGVYVSRETKCKVQVQGKGYGTFKRDTAGVTTAMMVADLASLATYQVKDLPLNFHMFDVEYLAALATLAPVDTHLVPSIVRRAALEMRKSMSTRSLAAKVPKEKLDTFKELSNAHKVNKRSK